VDAESNLRSSRRQLDKLRDLRSEEMEVRLSSHLEDCSNIPLPFIPLNFPCYGSLKEQLYSMVITYLYLHLKFI
jgi:hypothetical protein